MIPRCQLPFRHMLTDTMPHKPLISPPQKRGIYIQSFFCTKAQLQKIAYRLTPQHRLALGFQWETISDLK